MPKAKKSVAQPKGDAKKAANKKAPAAAVVKKGGKRSQQQKKLKKVSLFKKNERNYTIGNSLPPRKDLSRLVRWPRYIRLQRQKAVLYKRLKVPPTINQFNNTLDANQSGNLFRLLNKYRPEESAQKKARLLAQAKEKDPKAGKKPIFVKFGLNHVTALVEKKKAKLVVIAHDVDPIELVVWLPALCRKTGTPYVIVKGKARMGTVVHKKTAAVLALTEVRKEDNAALAQLVTFARDNFNDNVSARRTWGGGILGHKSATAQAKLNRALAREQRRKDKIAQ
jgi:large subunit ribosomal protein L7Ae